VKALGRAILDELDDETLAELAHRLAPHLPAAPAPAQDGWLSTRQAAEYAGCTVASLHRAMAAHEVEFAQSTPGGKAWFRRSDIDTWRRGH
jgi:Helix-turn-helix domain